MPDIPAWVNQISIHTLTWRVTCQQVGVMVVADDFNPHPHVEGDAGSAFTAPSAAAISIHTLTWRVTLFGEGFDVPGMISIHTLTWRVTRPVPTAAGMR